MTCRVHICNWTQQKPGFGLPCTHSENKQKVNNARNKPGEVGVEGAARRPQKEKRKIKIRQKSERPGQGGAGFPPPPDAAGRAQLHSCMFKCTCPSLPWQGLPPASSISSLPEPVIIRG